MKKNELIKNDVSIYRILSIKEKILVIDCIKQTMPFFVDDISGVTISEKELQIETGVILSDVEDLPSNYRKIAYEKYTVICSIIPFVDNNAQRNCMIKYASEQFRLSKQTIRTYLCQFLSFQNISVLAPKEKKERELNSDEKTMRWALNKYFYTRNKNSLKTSYEMMLKAKYCDDFGKLIDNYPTFNQFRYFYRKTRKEEKYLISRNGLKDYQKNNRPLLGDGIQQYAPYIGTAMLDSTICDIYLVNESGELVGRPVLSVACDANTSLCLGYSLGWEGNTYSLVRLMLSIIENKVEMCKAQGIEIKATQWNVEGVLPSVIITDGGSEYTSSTFSQITDLGVTLIKEPPYRADLKGTVEKCFDVLQNLYKDVLKGKGVIMPDFQERGSHDYRKDACLTLDDFNKIVVRCIVYYNSERILENYPYTEEMLNIKPYSSDIWNWKMLSEFNSLIKISKEELVITLFPRTIGRFSRYGLKVNKLRYHREGYKEQYLKGGKVEVSYNPDDVSRVWIKNDLGDYVDFLLIEKRFYKKKLSDVDDLLSKQSDLIKTEQEASYQAKIDLLSYIEGVSLKNSPNNIELKDIRKTRAREKRRNHKNLGENLNE